MPKMKSNRGARKRFRISGSGRIKRGRANRRHLLTKKKASRKLRLSPGVTVDKTNATQVKRMLLA